MPPSPRRYASAKPMTEIKAMAICRPDSKYREKRRHGARTLTPLHSPHPGSHLFLHTYMKWYREGSEEGAVMVGLPFEAVSVL